MSFLATAIIAATACCNSNQKITVVPYPNSVEISKGHFKANGAELSYSEDMDARCEAVICKFAEQLSLVSGTESKTTKGLAENGFAFILDTEMPAEAYSIEIAER